MGVGHMAHRWKHIKHMAHRWKQNKTNKTKKQKQEIATGCDLDKNSLTREKHRIYKKIKVNGVSKWLLHVDRNCV